MSSTHPTPFAPNLSYIYRSVFGIRILIRIHKDAEYGSNLDLNPLLSWAVDPHSNSLKDPDPGGIKKVTNKQKNRKRAGELLIILFEETGVGFLCHTNCFVSKPI